MKYNDQYPNQLLDLMGKGLLNCEIYAEWDICKDTFYQWIDKYPDFKDAYERGKEKSEAFYVRKAREAWLNQDEKGFKYFIAIMNNKFKWGTGAGQQTANQINIGNINVLEAKSDKDLISIIQHKLSKLPIEIPVQSIEAKIEDEVNTDDGSI